ncbi:MAG: hypothetical protein U1G07_12595 [Verrucomicrobiota bacterium]
MHSIRGLVIALFIVSSPLLTRAEPRVSGLITANAGTRFQLADPDGDGVLTHTVSGLAQVSRLGNCYVSFDVAAYPAPAGKPWKLVGTMRLVSAEDKDTVLDLDVSGWVLPDDNTPFGKFHYDALIPSGRVSSKGLGAVPTSTAPPCLSIRREPRRNSHVAAARIGAVSALENAGSFRGLRLGRKLARQSRRLPARSLADAGFSLV